MWKLFTWNWRLLIPWSLVLVGDPDLIGDIDHFGILISRELPGASGTKKRENRGQQFLVLSGLLWCFLVGPKKNNVARLRVDSFEGSHCCVCMTIRVETQNAWIRVIRGVMRVGLVFRPDNRACFTDCAVMCTCVRSGAPACAKIKKFGNAHKPHTIAHAPLQIGHSGCHSSRNPFSSQQKSSLSGKAPW